MVSGRKFRISNRSRKRPEQSEESRSDPFRLQEHEQNGGAVCGYERRGGDLTLSAVQAGMERGEMEGNESKGWGEEEGRREGDEKTVCFSLWTVPMHSHDAFSSALDQQSDRDE